MTRSNPFLVFALITGIITTGCQSSRSISVADYRPGHPAELKTAPDSEVFVLWRWTPAQPVVAAGSKQPAAPRASRQFPVEVMQAFAERGETVGFYRRDGILMAYAGGAERRLDEAHYTWKSQPGTNLRTQAQDNGFADAVGTVLEVALVIVLLPIGLFLSAYANDDDSGGDSGGSGGNQSKPAHNGGGGAQHPSHPKPPASKPAT